MSFPVPLPVMGSADRHEEILRTLGTNDKEMVHKSRSEIFGLRDADALWSSVGKLRRLSEAADGGPGDCHPLQP